MNIKIVLEMGISVQKCMILLSTKVRSPTTIKMKTIMMPSRLRLLRSSSEMYDTGFLYLFLLMALEKTNYESISYSQLP